MIKQTLRVLLTFSILFPLITPAALAAPLPAPLAPNAGDTERVSVASDGTQGNNSSDSSSVSATGRYVAFQSAASNLVNADGNASTDVFVRDRLNGTTELISLSSDEVLGNGASGPADISADGRYVAFQSAASNLVTGDVNAVADVFVRDRVNGTTERVSLSSDETPGNGESGPAVISADGRYVAFRSTATNLVLDDTNAVADIFVRDRVNGTTELVSLASDGTRGNNTSSNPSISADGRYVSYYSYASNLVSADTNTSPDVFVRDRVSGTTERVSVASDEAQGNDDSFYQAIAGNGRFVAFVSFSSNLVSGDTNGLWDVFVRDLLSGTTERVSMASDGTQGDLGSDRPAISADGRYVTFYSYSTNLVSGDTNGRADVFLRDRLSGITERVSRGSVDIQGNGGSFFPSISANGRCVAYQSFSSNLVAGDSNLSADVFVRDLEAVSDIFLPLLYR